MGLFRFYLAAAVIAWHTNGLAGFLPIPGYTAVQVFYVISGFYMALVLNTKYLGPGSYRVFLANRLLRIYPSYWATMLVTFAACFVGNWYLGHSRLSPYQHEHLEPLTWLFLVGTNLTILGQDITLFLDLNANGALVWPANFSDRHGTHLHLFMLLPQGWSLSLELMFYMIAPFLVRRKLWIVGGVIALTFVVRFFTYYRLGYNEDPWRYRFFPSELGLFLAGTISYHIYRWIKANPPAKGWIIGVSMLLGVVTVAYEFLLRGVLPDGWYDVGYWAYFVFATVAIPFLFRWTEKNKLDRYIGELSFPVYILHILVLMFTANFLPHRPGEMNHYVGLVCLVISTILAMGMMKFFIEPIDRFRHHLKPRDLEPEKLVVA